MTKLKIPGHKLPMQPGFSVENLELEPPPKEGPAILLYDIETAPSLVYTWSNWKTNVVATERDWYVLSFAYRWLGGKGTHVVSLRQGSKYDPDEHDDYYVVARLWALFDAADATVAHNGDRFDKRKANTRFLYHQWAPPAPYVTIDTKKELDRYFSHYSHALNEFARYHNLGEKVHHEGIHLWLNCMAGVTSAWVKMEKYNRRDVKLLEELYFKLLPWMGSPGHTLKVNVNHWQGWNKKNQCPKCGHDVMIKRGFHRTTANTYQTRQCKRCGGYSRVAVASGGKTEVR